jgi:polysaccharide export outer membrane protein
MKREGQGPHSKSSAWLWLIAACTLLASCVRHPELVNFNEGDQFPEGAVPIIGWEPLRIQTDDLLFVSISGSNQEVLQDFQSSQERWSNSADSYQPLRGFLVDDEGMIYLPVLGAVPATGLTTDSLRQKIEDMLRGYLQQPVVKVRFMNFKVTVLGEVALPGVVQAEGQRLNVLEAIGRAGDITNLGNRERILLIRETNGQRTFVRLNLRDRDIFNSPFFYLRQNDVLYVEPSKAKRYIIADATTRILPWAGIVTGLLNLVLILSR